LFRLGIVSNLVGQVCFVFLGLAFYDLFKSTDKSRARTLLALVTASVPIAFLSMLNKLAPLVLLKDPGFLKAFEPAQLQALAMLFLELHKYGSLLAGIFWGLWLFPLGLLVFESGYFPRFLGVLLFAGFAGYLGESLAAFLFPSAGKVVSPIFNMLMIIGEVPFMLWLIIFGARERLDRP
jgi:hypothetical protein